MYTVLFFVLCHVVVLYRMNICGGTPSEETEDVPPVAPPLFHAGITVCDTSGTTRYSLWLCRPLIRLLLMLRHRCFELTSKQQVRARQRVGVFRVEAMRP